MIILDRSSCNLIFPRPRLSLLLLFTIHLNLPNTILTKGAPFPQGLMTLSFYRTTPTSRNFVFIDHVHLYSFSSLFISTYIMKYLRPHNSYLWKCLRAELYQALSWLWSSVYVNFIPFFLARESTISQMYQSHLLKFFVRIFVSRFCCCFFFTSSCVRDLKRIYPIFLLEITFACPGVQPNSRSPHGSACVLPNMVDQIKLLNLKQVIQVIILT